MPRPRRILVCPLDWGLGHATRCIPIIRSLIERKTEVFIASSGSALGLLKLEFPTNVFFELPPYDPEYAVTGSMVGKMLRQLPKFKRTISAEHRAIEEFVRKNEIEVVISDNRYGCWASGIRSTLITHQLNLVMPDGFGWASYGVNWLLRKQIENFDAIWIPDQPGSHLTDPFYKQIIADQQYIGWLSRFEWEPSTETGYQIVAIVSGPEPQRTELEKEIRRQLKSVNAKSLLVLGQPGHTTCVQEGNVMIVNHLPAMELQKAIRNADLIVSRSGYSTIMDLIALKKNAVFIPTPGQPEQTVLANYLDKKGIIVARSQENFDLREAIEASKSYKGLGVFEMDMTYLATALDSVV